MFGNGLGWTISALIVGATIWLLVIMAEQGEISPPGPVGRDAATYTIDLPIDSLELKRPGFMSEPIDAAMLYQAAISLYETDRDALSQVGRIFSTESEDAQRWSRIMDLLQQAAQSQRPGVFSPAIGQVINYDPERPKLEAIRTIGRVAIRLALLAKDEAKRGLAYQYAEAAFALGIKLYEERLTLSELDVAQDLLGMAVATLANLADEGGDAELARKLQDFQHARIRFWTSRVLPVQQALQSMETNAGDLLALAQNAGDPMWRVEAILALGRCKYLAARGADQRAARKMLDIFSRSSDPRIRTAATAARDLSIVEYRKLR